MATHVSRCGPAVSLRRIFLSKALCLALALLSLIAPGCKNKSGSSHTNDPNLQAIDQLLNKQLPKGTSRARLSYFLDSRGYTQEVVKRDYIVAIVHHVDTQTLQPSTARVTFHFDANDRLISYGLQPAPELGPQR